MRNQANDYQLVRVDKGLHRLAKMEALKDKTSIQDWLSNLVRNELNARAKFNNWPKR